MDTPNYSAIRHAYIAGYIDENGAHQYYSLEELAKQYGLSHSTLLHRSSDEGWRAQREKFQEKIYRQAFAQFESDMASYLSEADRLAAKIATSMLRHIDSRLERAETDRERDALVIKYGKAVQDILNAVHSGAGIERLLERIEKRYGIENLMGMVG